MDSGTTVVTDQISPEHLTGRRIITSNNVEPGQAHITVDYILCRPTHDLVWPNVWRNIVYSERNKAQRHLDTIVWDLYQQLGLSDYYA